MKLSDLKKEIEKYQYFEDTNIIDISLASIIATRLKIGDPVWLVLIGPSSGGKSQILRPLSMTDSKFLHRVDDLTENTLLSGGKLSGGVDASLLNRIGPQGMLVMSDLTVLFSKSAESRASILAQLRMVYDGEMTKFVGTSDKPITWKGHLGVLAGSTPSLYAHFEEVADMGERFIYYRMKSYNAEKATRLAMAREVSSRNLDDKLGELYAEYIKEVVKGAQKKIELPQQVKERILQVAMFAERIRTPMHLDFRSRDVDRIPITAMPMRVALQLTTIAKALLIMKRHEKEDENGEFEGDEIKALEWCGYSLANEEKRSCLEVLAKTDYGTYIKTQTIADIIGLSTPVTRSILQNLAAIGVLTRSGGEDSTAGLSWSITRNDDWIMIRNLSGISENTTYSERNITSEEIEESEKISEKIFEEL